MRVVPIQVVGDVGSGGAHAAVGLEVHPFVLHAAPQALYEDVVAPGATPVHGQLAALGQNRFGELDCGELAALVGVDDLGHAVAREGRRRRLYPRHAHARADYRSFATTDVSPLRCRSPRQLPAAGAFPSLSVVRFH